MGAGLHYSTRTSDTGNKHEKTETATEMLIRTSAEIENTRAYSYIKLIHIDIFIGTM